MLSPSSGSHSTLAIPSPSIWTPASKCRRSERNNLQSDHPTPAQMNRTKMARRFCSPRRIVNSEMKILAVGEGQTDQALLVLTLVLGLWPPSCPEIWLQQDGVP